MKAQLLLSLIPLFFGCSQEDRSAESTKGHLQKREPIQAQSEKIQINKRPEPKQVSENQVHSTPAFSPETQSITPYYFMPTLNSEDGLAMDMVGCSFQDSRGNLWFGTFGGGVSKYDGKSFTTYTEAVGLASNTVQDISQDKDGNLWFATNSGVSQFDGLAFKSWTTKHGLINDDVSTVFQDSKGRLWFGTREGVSLYNGHSFTNYSKKDGLPDQTVWTIREDRRGHIWFATANGIGEFDGKTFRKYNKEDGLVHNAVQSMLFDSSGNLWLGTAGGMSRFDGHRFTNFTSQDGLVSNDVRAILQDRDNTIWFATLGGVSRFDGSNFTNYTSKHGLINEKVTTILQDKNGSIWFGTRGGVSQFRGTSFTNFTPNQGMPNAIVYHIFGDHLGTIWLSTDGQGIVRYDGKSFATYKKKQGLLSDTLFGLFEDKQHNLWFGSIDAGVVRFDGKSFTNYTEKHGLADNFVQAGIQDTAGNLWFGTASGISKFDGQTFTNFSKQQGLGNNSINFILQDKKQFLWFATNRGVSRFNGKQFDNFNKKYGFPADQVFHIYEDTGGALWFSTSAGLVRYDGSTFLTYTVQDGLPDNTIMWTAGAPRGGIFVGTNRGLVIFSSYTANNNTVEAQSNLTNQKLAGWNAAFAIYNANTGYPVRDTNTSSNYVDSNGILWFGTGSTKTGLVRFDSNELQHNKNPPTVWLQNLKINNEPISWNALKKNNSAAEEITAFGRSLEKREHEYQSETFAHIKFDKVSPWFSIPTALKLPHAFNTVTFDFLAIEPDQPRQQLYQYKLNGYQHSWSNPSTQTFVNFNNIFEGNYTFQVRAKRPGSDWGKPANFQFLVEPPWFRTYLAYALYSAFAFSTLFGIFRWRTAVLRKRQKQLEILYDAAERFLPKDFLHLLNREHVQDVELGDSAEINVTIMFSDIRGFTTLAEKVGPQTTAMLLNEYMRLMAPIVRRFNGVVGQFLGDGILAFFDRNAPDGIHASFEMQKALPQFNQFLKEHKLDPVHTGTALNGGPSIFTVTGEEKRLQATIISDDVNLTARIESLNKYYNTNILVTGSVYDALENPSEIFCILIDKVIVVGRSTAVRIYALWPSLDQQDSQKFKQLKIAFEKGFSAYERGDFTQAHQYFRNCLEYDLLDGAVGVLIERCLHFEKSGQPTNWNGTITLKEK